MRFRIIETTEYEVEAENADEALDLFLDHGPVQENVEGPVTFWGVSDRDVIQIHRDHRDGEG